MSLSPGTRLGPYEIVAPLGAGGMGEVYRARDTRLGRDVAIKVLPSHLTATPEARARFEREARAISHLNHPNICTLHDVGREGETDYLVMELVSGGSLRDLLTRKGLSVDRVLALGAEIADALEAAHARGIVHRDLKPSNILLTERGQAKVMDFGLATAFRRGAKSSDSMGVSTGAVTETEEHLTSPGQVVGTVAYMSPEQARGEEVDARSDVFSLGSVLYEMASGHRAFEGSSTAVIFEAILNRAPAPVSLMREGVPAEVDRILSKALEKDREMRYQTAGEVRSDLKRLKRDIESSGSARVGSGVDSGSKHRPAGVTLPAAVVARRRLMRAAWVGASCVALAGAILLATRFANNSPPSQTVRLSFEAPPTASYMDTPRISPDGHYVAFGAQDSTGVGQVWVRPMDGSIARPIPGTEGGGRPIWSPDSRYIGFLAGGKFKTVDVKGGQPVTICDADGDLGSWGSAGKILLDGGAFDTIRVFSAAGGQPAQATWLDRSRGEWGHAWPSFLPDGKHFLYLANGAANTALRVGCLGSKESKILAEGTFSRAEYVAPGYILFAQGRTLMARPFDAKRLRMVGDAFPVVDDVVSLDGDADFSASTTGTLVYRDEYAMPKSKLVWMDRAGKESGTLGPTAVYMYGLAFSPDKKRIAMGITTRGEVTPDVWLVDVERDVSTRLTSYPGVDFDPVWSADGATIFFQSRRGGDSRIWQKPSSGTGEERELAIPPGAACPGAATPDGHYLLGSMSPPGGSWDMVKISLEAELRTTPLGVGSKGKWRGFLFPELSPDGKWIAYWSNESGRDEVYVVDFPGLTGKWRVSTDGGSVPRWSASGKELYYLSPAPDGGLMAAAVSTVPVFRVAPPKRLFRAPDASQYLPAPDGTRFLMCTAAKGEKLPSTKVVINWLGSLRPR